MIEYLENDNCSRFKKDLLQEVLNIAHALLPLKYKFLPESYVFTDGDEIYGIITVVPTRGNPYKINITRLILGSNFFDTGKQLIEFVLSRYGAKGAATFVVSAESSHKELLDLFLNGCGFRQCSYENLWKIENFYPSSDNCAVFRAAQNSDSKYISRLYNGELQVHFRPSLERIKQEFCEPLFSGMTSFYKNRYVLEEPSKHRIIAYLSITTSDNQNFIIDISLCEGYIIPYDEVINFALKEISRRKSNFTAFLKHRQYTKNADKFEEYLHSRNLNCIQTKCILVKDFYKPIKQEQSVLQVFLMGDNKVSAN